MVKTTQLTSLGLAQYRRRRMRRRGIQYEGAPWSKHTNVIFLIHWRRSAGSGWNQKCKRDCRGRGRSGLRAGWLVPTHPGQTSRQEHPSGITTFHYKNSSSRTRLNNIQRRASHNRSSCLEEQGCSTSACSSSSTHRICQRPSLFFHRVPFVVVADDAAIKKVGIHAPAPA